MTLVWAVTNQRAAFCHVTLVNEVGTRGFVWNKLFIRNPSWRPSEFLGQRPLATRNGFD